MTISRLGPANIARMTVYIPQHIKDLVDPPRSQRSKSPSPEAKIQEEIEVENIEREIEELGSDIDLNGLDLSADGSPASP